MATQLFVIEMSPGCLLSSASVVFTPETAKKIPPGTLFLDGFRLVTGDIGGAYLTSSFPMAKAVLSLLVERSANDDFVIKIKRLIAVDLE